MTVEQLLWGVIIVLLGQITLVISLFMYTVSWLRSIDERIAKLDTKVSSIDNRLSNIKRDEDFR